MGADQGEEKLWLDKNALKGAGARKVSRASPRLPLPRLATDATDRIVIVTIVVVQVAIVSIEAPRVIRIILMDRRGPQ